MATYDDLIFSHRLFMKAYPFSHYAHDPVPCTPLSKPLREARVALVTSAGVSLPEQEGIAADRNLGFPLDRFRELEAQGVIGELNHRHFSFMGSIVMPRKLIDETSVQVAQMLRADAVDVVFLTPM